VELNVHALLDFDIPRVVIVLEIFVGEKFNFFKKIELVKIQQEFFLRVRYVSNLWILSRFKYFINLFEFILEICF